MNPILEKWLAEKEAEVKESRKEFLIEQGLVDPLKYTIVYKDVVGNIITEEEAKARKESELPVEENKIFDALDLTEEEFNQVLTYAQPQTQNNGEPTDHELLRKISRNTGIVSTLLIIYVIISVIGIIIAIIA